MSSDNNSDRDEQNSSTSTEADYSPAENNGNKETKLANNAAHSIESDYKTAITKESGKLNHKTTSTKKSLDSQNIDKLKKATRGLKNKIKNKELEHRIQQHTKSPKIPLILGCCFICIIIFTILYFQEKSLLVEDGINFNDVPLIEAQGELAGLPDEHELPFALTPIDKAFFTKTPRSPYLAGAADGLEYQKHAVKQSKLPLEIKNEIGMKFRLVPKGKFLMGSPDGEKGSAETVAGKESTEFQHQREIKNPFYAGKYEVTVQQWKTVMTVQKICDGCEIIDEKGVRACTCSNRSHEQRELPYNSSREPNNPVTGTSLNDCLAFTRRLNEALGKDAGFRYYILAEHEWEYCARAGCTKAYGFGPAVVAEKYAVTKNSTRTRNVENVGLRRPNAWGLHDMHGNAEEWTRTPYQLYACLPGHYAGSTMRKALKLRAVALNNPVLYQRFFSNPDDTSSILSLPDILRKSSWDIPIYDGQVPMNIIEPLKNFDTPLRTIGKKASLYFYDENNNDQYDQHETIWTENILEGSIGVFDPEYDTIILSFGSTKPPAGSKGANKGIYYYDKNGSHEWDPNESIWAYNKKARDQVLTYVMRGGAYKNFKEDCRSATRHAMQRQHSPTWAGVRLSIKLGKYMKKIK